MKEWTRPALKVALGALALRLVLLYLRGDYIVFDEGYYLLLARSLRSGHGFTLNGLPHVALSPLQPVLVAALSFLGVPDLWASRLLAAVCGAALVFPVASLAYRWFGLRGATLAACVVAVAPPLLTFLPFFPGERWNLYFGSEPLFLLLATSAVAVGAAAVDRGKLWLCFAAGALADLSYCTRLEGAILGTALGIALVVALARTRRALLARAVIVYAAGIVVAIPYFVYLHGALGRWAVSGRVQAAATSAAPVPGPVTPGGGASAVESFVWGGDVEALWRTLYALDGSKTQMSSQYWGVPRRPVVPAPPDSAPPAARTAPPPSKTGMLLRAGAQVLPVFLLVLAIPGLYFLRPRVDGALWLLPMAVTGIVPALLAYAEPRAMLMLVPAACIPAGGLLATMAARIEPRIRSATPALAIVMVILLMPTIVDAGRAWNQGTDLQQVATARRIVGEYLGAHLPPASRVVSWHPAIAIWADRDWRVLPYASFDDIVRYAQAQGARTVVFSRFDPSPLREPPRAFTAILVDPDAVPPGSNIHLEPVETTRQLFVGRLAAPAVP